MINLKNFEIDYKQCYIMLIKCQSFLLFCVFLHFYTFLFFFVKSIDIFLQAYYNHFSADLHCIKSKISIMQGNGGNFYD